MNNHLFVYRNIKGQIQFEFALFLYLYAMKNIFADIPETLPKELVETLLHNQQVHIERIISLGHTTEWLDQEHGEWVILLQGQAKILFFGNEKPTKLNIGDYLWIPPHQKHRVSWTNPTSPSIWLAIHLT